MSRPGCVGWRSCRGLTKPGTQRVEGAGGGVARAMGGERSAAGPHRPEREQPVGPADDLVHDGGGLAGRVIPGDLGDGDGELWEVDGPDDGPGQGKGQRRGW